MQEDTSEGKGLVAPPRAVVGGRSEVEMIASARVLSRDVLGIRHGNRKHHAPV
jgi:hypothetical protein